MNTFRFKAFFITVFIGLIFTIIFVLSVGDQFATALFPTTALLAAFIISGFFVGYFSNGITFLEPGLGSIITAVILYFFIPVLNLKGFRGMWNSDWILIFMNAVLLTFAGAWLGEKFENTSLKTEQLLSKSFDWSWMIAGTMMGITSSIIIILIFDLLIGHNPDSFLVPFVLALFITGLIIGWKSPGYTAIEAGIAGFLTLTVLFNILRLTLRTESPVGVWTIIVGLLVGFLEAYFGAAIGEKIQEFQEKKRAKKQKKLNEL